MPKKRRVVVVVDDDDDDDDDDAAPPKPGPSPKGKGKERARERRRGRGVHRAGVWWFGCPHPLVLLVVLVLVPAGCHQAVSFHRFLYTTHDSHI